MTNNIPHLIPPGFDRLMKSHERIMEREQKKRGAKISDLLRRGKVDEAIEYMTLERAPVLSKVQKFLDAMPPEPAKQTDRSRDANLKRQKKLVEILTSGQRCSLNRAWKLSGYGEHRQSLDQLLSSNTILDLFKKAVAQGRPLPLRYKERIEHALEEYELGVR